MKLLLTKEQVEGNIRFDGGLNKTYYGFLEADWLKMCAEIEAKDKALRGAVETIEKLDCEKSDHCILYQAKEILQDYFPELKEVKK